MPKKEKPKLSRKEQAKILAEKAERKRELRIVAKQAQRIEGYETGTGNGTGTNTLNFETGTTIEKNQEQSRFFLSFCWK